MKKLIFAITILGSMSAHAATAYWTGASHYVFRQGMNCEYSYAGNSFWVTFVSTQTCPNTVEVQ